MHDARDEDGWVRLRMMSFDRRVSRAGRKGRGEIVTCGTSFPTNAFPVKVDSANNGYLLPISHAAAKITMRAIKTAMPLGKYADRMHSSLPIYLASDRDC